MPLPVTLDQPITFDSLLCKDTCINLESTDGNFCFQLPLFEDTGTNLLSLTEVGYARVFQYTIDTNDAVNTTSGSTPCGSPFTNDSQVIDAFAKGLQIATAGQYFFDVELGDTSITYGINPDDDCHTFLLSVKSPTLVTRILTALGSVA